MFADLHLHTTESDGTWTPAQLVDQALKVGLSAIAITDHDTTAGIEAAALCAPSALHVIPGIELSSVSGTGEEVHIVGLWIDPKYGPLQNKLTEMRQERITRIDRILARLADLGISLKPNDVMRYAHKDVVSRSHVASALVAKGFVKSKQQAFEAYIGQGAPAYVERPKLTPEHAIDLILQAGGVPVLAHPGLLKDQTIIPGLVQAGLIGIEVVHHSHTTKQKEYFMQLALDTGLLPSGGSDCHGPEGKDKIYIGQYSIPWSWLQDLKKSRL